MVDVHRQEAPGVVKCVELRQLPMAVHHAAGAQIACDGVALPQGSPCSAVISELVGQVLDLRLLRFTKKYGVRVRDAVEERLFARRRDPFTDLWPVFMGTTTLSFHAAGRETLGRQRRRQIVLMPLTVGGLFPPMYDSVSCPIAHG